MATSFSAPIDAFLVLVETDREFFNYFNVMPEGAIFLAKQRASNYLTEARARMIMDGRPSVDFNDVDEDKQQFNFDLTPQEIFILSHIMYERYMFRDISKLKTREMNFTSAELKVFDPSNARSTFMSMYNNVCAQNAALLDTYKNTDRLTGEFKGISVVEYDSE